MDDTVTGPLTTLVWQPPGGAAALRPDGAEAVTGGYDGSLTVWNVASGRAVRSWPAHRGWVWACVYHPRHDVLVSTGADGMGRVWDGLTGALLAEFKPGGRAFHSIAFSPDGELLATFGWSGAIVVWRSTTEPLVAMTGHDGWVSSVVFHPGGTQVVSTGGDGTLRVWDLADGALHRTVHRSDHALGDCTFRPGADQLALAGSTGIRLWDSTTWDLLRHDDQVPADVVAAAPDGRRLAAGGIDGVKLWDVPTGEVVTAPLGDPTGVQWLGFSPDGREVMVRQVESLSWLDAASGDTLRSTTGSIGAQVTAGACDGAVLVTGGQDGRVRIWDVGRGAIQHTIAAHTGPVLDVVVRGHQVVSAGADGVACLIDAAHGVIQRSWSADFVTANRCFLRPDGSTVLVAGNRPGVGVWRLDTGTQVDRVLPEVYRVFDLVVTAAGRELVLAQSIDGGVGTWDTATGRSLGRCDTDDLYASSAALSPDGTVVVTGDHDGRLQWWNTTDGRLLRTSDAGLAPLSCCAFAPDGRELLTGHVDGRVVAWDPVTGQVGRHFDGQYGQVGFCAYSADGRTVLAGGADRSTRMWDAATATPVGFRFEALPQGEAVAWSAVDGSPADASPGAQRWLGRSVVDPDTRTSRWVPHRDG